MTSSRRQRPSWRRSSSDEPTTADAEGAAASDDVARAGAVGDTVPHATGPDGAPEIVAHDPIGESVTRWRGLLGDLADGSALWDVDSLRDAAVELTTAHPGGVAQMFAGRPTRLSSLAREGSALTHARRRARVVAARTEELAQRYGFAPTYVALGVATWTPPAPPAPEQASTDVDDGVPAPTAPPSPEAVPAATPSDADATGGPIRVPVLLRPVTLTALPADGDVELALDPAVEVNPVLLRALRALGVRIDAAELIAATRAEHGFTPAPALDLLRRRARDDADLEIDIEPRIVLGAFLHPGQALAEDLDVDRLRQHEVVAALAGSGPDERSLRTPLPARRSADPAPGEEPGVGDLDAGQHRVLDAVASGMHLFVDAPPGVDVPGTVAALAAQVARDGRRVLYVPGTKRAGESFHASMRALGLGDLVLDLGTDIRWRDTAADRIVDGLDARVPDDDPAVAEDREALLAARDALAGYVGALHTQSGPWDASPYHAMQELAELTSQRPGPRTQVRLEDQALTMTVAERQHAREELARAAALGAFRLRASDTPWYGAVLSSAEHATETLERVRRLGRSLPTLLEQVAATTAQTGLDEASTLRQWSEQLDLLEGIRASLDLFLPAVFERSAVDMAAAAASRTWRQQHGSTLSWGERRRLRKQARDLQRPGVAVVDLHAELLSVQARREVWRRHCAGGGWPRLPEAMADVVATEHDVAVEIAELQDVLSPSLGGADLRDVPLPELADRIARLGDDDATLRQMPERAGVLGHLARMGLRPLVEDLTARRVPTDLVGPEFDLAWWSSLLEAQLRGEEALADIDASSLDDASARLRELDARQVASLRDPVLAGVARHVRAAIAADKPSAQEMYRSVRRGANDLRTLQRHHGTLAWAPRPVWVVPPMLVPQVLEPERTVDLVVLDAVQHLPVEQAVAAISRGRQVVVVGDSRRGGEGLVAAASVLPTLELPGDRLDLDSEIGGFLAEHGYAEVIRPVPGPPRPPGISLELVDGTGMPGIGSEAVESVQVEVDHVVDLVIDHALARPDQSLAVIALNARHADRLREAVLSTAAGASVAAFFDPDRPEPFTVVDVEAVAGLRRDAVVLTVGYGKTPHGRVLYRFGAVSGEHGAELLVDALDACRHRLTVVSCLDPDELDPERLRTPGAVALRDLLAFARDGVAHRTITEVDVAEGRPDRLLADLADRLRRMGLVVVPRYGPEGGVRVPLAVGHPALPEELLLALLTDDPEYVAEPSLRRRDRHWVQRLENRGWRVQMVFSTAVFMDPQGEAEKVRSAVEEVVADRLGRVPAIAAPLDVPLVVEADDEPDELPGDPIAPPEPEQTGTPLVRAAGAAAALARGGAPRSAPREADDLPDDVARDHGLPAAGADGPDEPERDDPSEVDTDEPEDRDEDPPAGDSSSPLDEQTPPDEPRLPAEQNPGPEDATAAAPEEDRARDGRGSDRLFDVPAGLRAKLLAHAHTERQPTTPWRGRHRADTLFDDDGGVVPG